MKKVYDKRTIFTKKICNYIINHKKCSKFLLILIGCFVILTFNLRNIKILTSPNILFDEFGYLSSGALFSGRDWSDVTSNFVPYYAYGYGFVIAIVLRFISNAVLAYQTLIFVNAIMVCAIFILSNYVCSSIIYDMRIRIIMCFGLCFYPGIIHNTQFVWTETLLTFLFWLILALLKSLICNPNVLKSGLFGVLSVYLYMVHQRCLGILCVAIIMITFLMFLKIINKKHFWMFIIAIVIAMMLHFVLKDYVQNYLWNSNDATIALDANLLLDKVSGYDTAISNVNDYEGQKEKVLYIFTREGFNCFLMGVFGKIFYLGITSFFFGLEGIYYVICKGTNLFLKYKASNLKDDKIYILLFSVMSFAVTILIAAIFHVHPGRIDTVLYGRYTDWLIPILVIVGLYSVYTLKMSLKRLFIYFTLALTYLCFLNPFINKYDLWKNFATCSPITFLFRNRICNCDVKWVSVMFLVMIGCSVIIWKLISLNNINWCWVGVVLMILIWIRITNPAINFDINMGNQKELSHIVDVLNRDSDKTIYYVFDSEDVPLYIGGLQYLLEYRSIEVIESEQLKSVNEGIVIFDSNSIHKNMINRKFDNIESNYLCDVYFN